ncbi:hypothetical protein [Methylobacterium persicinum]|uniref:RAG2 PHD domain containing protein n=1 Tax=Methylobacterium persicinum TaxID=374426 RepID=A0ABU0HHH7_9HYPH|nr:hypothetical protein [Methylobacterium persicinum]MDQ0441785.1 hypothetical protein [Methylobacterium persicinum]GJE37970.1 hypothetical protein KHHGKMAE_2035 [Methylobacterium persicinum]
MSTALSLSDIPARPIRPEENRFVVGQDSQGRWVAVEIHGRGGGLFKDRKTACHYAAGETGRRADAVIISHDKIELAT